MENSEYLGWIALKTSYSLCLEQRMLPVAGRRGTNNKNIQIVLLKLRCHTGFQIDYNFLLYKFAGASSWQKPQSADAQGKARALRPAAAGASPSPASATAPDGAAPDAGQALLLQIRELRRRELLRRCMITSSTILIELLKSQ